MARVLFHNYNHPVFKADATKSNIKGKVVEESVYYWWWIALRRSSKYKQACAKKGVGMQKLYDDFGDIFAFDEDDRQKGFEAWWNLPHNVWGNKGNLGAYLFSEPPLTYDVQQLEPSDLPLLSNGWDTKEQAIMSIPLQLPKHEILRRLKLEIDKIPNRRQDSQKKWKRESKSRYKVEDGYFYNYREQLKHEKEFIENGPLWNLQKTLKTYDYWKLNPKKKQWQIVYELNKMDDVTTKAENSEKVDVIKEIMRDDSVTKEKASQIYKKQYEDLDTDTVREKRTSDYSTITGTALDGEKNSSGAEFKRRQKKWEQLIAGVEEGKFPMGLRKHGK
jgi:hypothetical protein